MVVEPMACHDGNIFDIFNVGNQRYKHFIYKHVNICFISCVLKILSKIVWFIKILFYRFLNLSMAMFLTCVLIFLHLEPYVS